MKAILAHNETARLEALRRYQILDTICEAAFDDLTRLAAQICATPIALISLIDDCRQWFKSKVGIDVESTSLDVAFCVHAIPHPNDILLVPDTLVDHRFVHNPLVTSEPYIRFYAGAPLVTPDGYVLGTLCVVDYVPRQLSLEQLDGLRSLSRQVMAQLELKYNLNKLKSLTDTKYKQIDDLISTFSHEIRTPLVATRIALHALLGGAFGPVSDLCADVLKECSQNNDNLLKLVEALLEISRHKTDFGKSLNFEILNWENIFTQAIISNNTHRQPKCTVHCEIDSPLPIVYGDQREIQRVVQNFLDNAVRVSQPGQKVALQVEQIGINTLKVSVHDNGPGVAPQEKEKLFYRFIPGRGRREGFGLGLYLCRQIIEAHGGNIGVETSVGEGSTFWFTLPINPILVAFQE